jgi:hypothetical protein
VVKITPSGESSEVDRKESMDIEKANQSNEKTIFYKMGLILCYAL